MIAAAAASVVVIAVLVAVIVGPWFVFKSVARYQKRADAENQVKVTTIQIRNQAQRILVAQQQAEIRHQEAIGVRKAQDEIARTLTPLYVQFEAFKALERLGESGANNSVYFVPLTENGLPVVPTLETGTGVQK